MADAVRTAVINKRAGGMGLISGRKAFQRPMKQVVVAASRPVGEEQDDQVQQLHMQGGHDRVVCIPMRLYVQFEGGVKCLTQRSSQAMLLTASLVNGIQALKIWGDLGEWRPATAGHRGRRPSVPGMPLKKRRS